MEFLIIILAFAIIVLHCLNSYLLLCTLDRPYGAYLKSLTVHFSARKNKERTIAGNDQTREQFSKNLKHF